MKLLSCCLGWVKNKSWNVHLQEAKTKRRNFFALLFICSKLTESHKSRLRGGWQEEKEEIGQNLVFVFTF